jgi:hypothetical protein
MPLPAPTSATRPRRPASSRSRCSAASFSGSRPKPANSRAKIGWANISRAHPAGHGFLRWGRGPESRAARSGYAGCVPSWRQVVEIGQALPGVEVGTSFGTPALRVRGKLMCRRRTDPDALVLRVVDLGEREALLQGQPDAFFSTAHYDGYPYVLVRLEAVDPVELRELIEEAWRLRAPKRLVTAHDEAAAADAR